MAYADHNVTLPLAIVENDSHVSIKCTARNDCVWTWRLSSDQHESNGRVLEKAIAHAFAHQGEVNQ